MTPEERKELIAKALKNLPGEKVEDIAGLPDSMLQLFAEMSWLPDSRGSYLVMAQREQENIVGTVWAHVEGNKIKRIDMRPADCIDTLGRSGEYPT
jgi:hypothetical protein